MPKTPEWSNEVSKMTGAVERTSRDEHLAELAEKAKQVKPQLYTVTSRNKTAIRIIHDHDGNAITIEPEKTKEDVLLRPNTAEYLNKGDLTVTAA